MASPYLESPWLSAGKSLCEQFEFGMDVDNTAEFIVLESPTSSVSCRCSDIPKAPPLPAKACSKFKYQKRFVDCGVVPKETVDMWDKLFKEALGADVYIITQDASCIPAHSSILVSLLSFFLSSS